MTTTTNTVLSRARRIVRAGIVSTTNATARCQLKDIKLHAHYAEPGYTDPVSGAIATGNWNTVAVWSETHRRSIVVDTTPERVADLLEKLGVELEWSDEWTDCHECGGLVRSHPDSYHWMPSHDYDGSGISVCHQCRPPLTDTDDATDDDATDD